MTFVWRDRFGRTLDLSNVEPILEEIETVSQMFDALLGLAVSTDTATRDAARVALRRMHADLERLAADGARWNAYVDSEARRAAGEFIAQIDALPAQMEMLTLVVELHDEHDAMIDRTARVPTAREAVLAEPATAIQRRAIDASGASPLPAETATRGEVYAWLDELPQFARSRAVDAGWFHWVDREGHAHQLDDPLPIEREIVAFARKFAGMREVLTDASQPDTLHAVVNISGDLLERIENLQCDLKRFERESLAREDNAWSKFALDWRSKRKTA